MKIFAIKSDDRTDMLAYLIYYEKDKRFFIELPENADCSSVKNPAKLNRPIRIN